MKKITLFALTLLICLNLAAQQYTKLIGDYSSIYCSPVTFDGSYVYGWKYYNGQNLLYRIKSDGTGYEELNNYATGIVGFHGLQGGKLLVENGWLYGVANDLNTGLALVFKMKPDGSQYSILCASNYSNGEDSIVGSGFSSLLSDGTYLYTTSFNGGSTGAGSIIKINKTTGAMQLLHSFSAADSSKGVNPDATLTTDGTYLYGLTRFGGTTNRGIIYKIKTDGTGFAKVMDSKGTIDTYDIASFIYNVTRELYCDGTYLYGTSNLLGVDTGHVYKVKTDGTGYTIVHTFSQTEGRYPAGGVVSDGTWLYGLNIYGEKAITSGGSSEICSYLYKVKPDGSGFSTICKVPIDPNGVLLVTSSILHFDGATNAVFGTNIKNVFKVQIGKPAGMDMIGFPNASKTEGTAPRGVIKLNGALYGVTSLGGSKDSGSVFMMNADGSGYQTLHSFGGNNNGYTPAGQLTYDGTWLYGITRDGGNHNNGVIYKIKPDGTEFSKIFDISTDYLDYQTQAPIVSGNSLYGVFGVGNISNSGKGVIYKVNTDGTGFTELMAFDNTNKNINGITPSGSLYTDNTWLYGVNNLGGVNDSGVVFKIKLDGTGYTVLQNFNGTLRGALPSGKLIGDGTWLYGSTQAGGQYHKGVIYKIKTDGSAFQKLHEFNGTDGKQPHGGLAFDGTWLYGATIQGGAVDSGTVFKLKVDGSSFTKLVDLTGKNGRWSLESIITDTTFIYATTVYGGLYHKGVIFRYPYQSTGGMNIIGFPKSSITQAKTGVSNLINDGTYFYGVSFSGGAADSGCVYRMKHDGSAFQLLNEFNHNSGTWPNASLYNDGTYLYGTASRGGANNVGTVYKMNLNGTGFTVLHDFAAVDGKFPETNLISDGNYLYGTTPGGGSNGGGIIFKIKTDGTGFQNLYNFGAPSGVQPTTSLFYDGTYLYGTTSYGGLNGKGTLFKIQTDGSNFTTLFDFSTTTGVRPGALAGDGTYLYGFTTGGSKNGLGGIFRVKYDGTAFENLFNFTNQSGYFGKNALFIKGNYLYGTCISGGANKFGVAYRIKKDGGVYQKLFDFDGTKGSLPVGNVYCDGSYIYGSTLGGGINDRGAIYKIAMDTTAKGKGLSLYGFAVNGSKSGKNPIGTLINAFGYLYGTTYNGGGNDSGTVFRMKPDGSAYETILDFNGANGRNPTYQALYSDGTYLYGTARNGGSKNYGVLFKINPDGSGYQKLHEFDSSAANLNGGVISDGNYLYGTTYEGGSGNVGTVYKIDKNGNGFTLLVQFNQTNGTAPLGNLNYDGNYLYGFVGGGTNNKGRIFKVKTDGSGFQSVYDFNGTDGWHGWGNTMYNDGTYFYGMATLGGANNFGTVFKIKPDGTGFQKLMDFDGTNGKFPLGNSLISDGSYLYGCTSQGGTLDSGVVFRIKPDGTGYKKIMDLSGIKGTYALGSLYTDNVYLYGLAAGGGVNKGGAIFKVLIPGYKGAALSLDASKNNHINVPSGNINLTNTDFTFECWAKRRNINNQEAFLFGQGTSGSNTALHIGFKSNNFFKFGFYNNDLEVNAPTVDTLWHHWACVYDMTNSSGGSNRFIFMDGVQVAYDSATSPYLGSGFSTIGRNTFNPSLFDGDIDEVRIWNRALCHSEIKNNMHAELKMPQTGLIAYYKFNQGTGSGNNTGITIAADSSGNGYDGSLQNFVLTGSTSNFIENGAVVSGVYSKNYVKPVVSITGNTTVCKDSSTVLTVHGDYHGFFWSSFALGDTTIVAPKTTTTYTVIGVELGGCMSVPATATVTVDTTCITTSIPVTQNTTNGFVVYPNPAGITIQVISINEPLTTIEIYNTMGQVVFSEQYAKSQNRSVQINVSNLTPGVYFIKTTQHTQLLMKE